MRLLLSHPEAKGLNFEAVRGVPGVFSVRASGAWRILLRMLEDEHGHYLSLEALYEHDDAYRRR